MDTIGDHEDDYGLETEIGEYSDYDFDMGEDPHMEGLKVMDDPVDPIVIELEVQVGYAEKKSRLWVHYKHACDRGDVRWVKTTFVCRPIFNRNPYGFRALHPTSIRKIRVGSDARK